MAAARREQLLQCCDGNEDGVSVYRQAEGQRRGGGGGGGRWGRRQRWQNRCTDEGKDGFMKGRVRRRERTDRSRQEPADRTGNRTWLGSFSSQAEVEHSELRVHTGTKMGLRGL